MKLNIHFLNPLSKFTFGKFSDIIIPLKHITSQDHYLKILNLYICNHTYTCICIHTLVSVYTFMDKNYPLKNIINLRTRKLILVALPYGYGTHINNYCLPK